VISSALRVIEVVERSWGAISESVYEIAVVLRVGPCGFDFNVPDRIIQNHLDLFSPLKIIKNRVPSS